jgi:integrase
MIENRMIEQADPLVESFYEVNSEYKDTYVIKRILTPLSEIQRKELLELSEKTNYKHYLMIRTQLELGLRVNELINLSINQINFHTNMVLIQSRKAINGVGGFKTKTLSSNRELPLPKELSKLLKAYIGNRKSGYVFESRKDSKLFLKNTVIGFINAYCKACPSIGRNMGSHALRRTYASFLLQNKIPINEISKLLGHSSIRTTMLYLFELEPINYDNVRKVLSRMN